MLFEDDRPDGAGMPGQFPPLAGTEWVTGSKDRLIALVLRGLSEPIVVDGITYEQEMPGNASFVSRKIYSYNPSPSSSLTTGEQTVYLLP
jgi:hypothetical protein